MGSFSVPFVQHMSIIYDLSLIYNFAVADYELKILECCISCRAVNTSPKGQVVAGPNSASFVHPQNPSDSLECIAWSVLMLRPVVMSSLAKRLVSCSMISLNG